MFLRKLLIQLACAVLGLWLASRFVHGVQITDGITTLLLAGLVLGLINLFVKPILKAVTLPIRILTLGLFSFIINTAIIWGVDILFPKLVINGLKPLFLTALIVWGLGLLVPLLIPKKD